MTHRARPRLTAPRNSAKTGSVTAPPRPGLRPGAVAVRTANPKPLPRQPLVRRAAGALTTPRSTR